MAGPYRAEFGAIHHEDERGHLFVVQPYDRAESVAKAMNEAHQLQAWETNVLALLDSGDPDVVRVREGGGAEDLMMSLVVSVEKARKNRDKAQGTSGKAPSALARVQEWREAWLRGDPAAAWGDEIAWGTALDIARRLDEGQG